MNIIFSPFNRFAEGHGHCIYPIKAPYLSLGTLSHIWAYRALSHLGCSYILWILWAGVLKILCCWEVLLLQFDKSSSLWCDTYLSLTGTEEPATVLGYIWIQNFSSCGIKVPGSFFFVLRFLTAHTIKIAVGCGPLPFQSVVILHNKHASDMFCCQL